MSITLRTNSFGEYYPDRHIFNGGEVNVNIENFLNEAKPLDTVYIVARIANSDDLMELIMVCNALRCAIRDVKLNLTLPYLPYSRQDRVCNPGEALGARVFADMINELNFSKVVTYDAHSDVGVACINNCDNVPPENILEQANWGTNNVNERLHADQYVLVAPDAGAMKTVMKVANHFECSSVIHCEKVRNTKTGEITHTRVHGANTAQGKEVLIVDDICDGGRTFIEIAKVLANRPNSISLYVTHGIFSKGYQVLFDAGISKIYTTDSFEQDLDHPQVFVVGL